MLMHVHLVLASGSCTRQNAECTRLHVWSLGEWRSEVSEAAITADPASLAGIASPAGLPGAAANWRWLTSAAEMAAEVSGIWPFVRPPEALRCRGYPRVATRTPGASAESVRAARDFTAATLSRWGVADRREDIV